MNKQLKSVPSGNKGLKKLPTEVRNKMGYMAKGGAVMKAKGGSVKMAKGGAVMAKGGAVGKPKRERAKGAEPMKGMKGMKMAGGGMMAKGYKAGGVATKGGTKGGVTGGKMARKRDGIAKRGKTRA